MASPAILPDEVEFKVFPVTLPGKVHFPLGPIEPYGEFGVGWCIPKADLSGPTFRFTGVI